jgi:hypothetical protein
MAEQLQRVDALPEVERIGELGRFQTVAAHQSVTAVTDIVWGDVAGVVDGVTGGMKDPEGNVTENQVLLLWTNQYVCCAGNRGHLGVVFDLTGGKDKKMAFDGGQGAANLRFPPGEGYGTMVALGEVSGVAKVIKVSVGTQQTDRCDLSTLQGLYKFFPYLPHTGVH